MMSGTSRMIICGPGRNAPVRSMCHLVGHRRVVVLRRYRAVGKNVAEAPVMPPFRLRDAVCASGRPRATDALFWSCSRPAKRDPAVASQRRWTGSSVVGRGLDLDLPASRCQRAESERTSRLLPEPSQSHSPCAQVFQEINALPGRRSDKSHWPIGHYDPEYDTGIIPPLAVQLKGALMNNQPRSTPPMPPVRPLSSIDRAAEVQEYLARIQSLGSKPVPAHLLVAALNAMWAALAPPDIEGDDEGLGM